MTARMSLIACVCLLSAAVAGAQVDRPSPVTDAMLDNPPAADWLHWRQSPEGWGHSPLDQINRDNVAGLRLVWSWALEPGSQETTPLVHDGVMFLASPGNVIHALDAATGDLIWEYRRRFAEGVRGRGWTLRNLSIHGDKVFVNTADAHLVALDVHTGEVAWETTVADQRKGFTYRSGALVARGRVISGMSGCTRYYEDGCFITAHDAETGRELWRTSTIARPGEPSGDTWDDVDTGGRRSVFTMGKLGILWELDAATGDYRNATMHRTGRILWRHRQRTPFNSAALTTAGGLVFIGDWNRFANAYDEETSELLWQTRLPTSVQGFPISYAVDGRQYVAIPVGVGALAWSTIPLRLTPEVRRLETGNGIYVFALPERDSVP